MLPPVSETLLENTKIKDNPNVITMNDPGILKKFEVIKYENTKPRKRNTPISLNPAEVPLPKIIPIEKIVIITSFELK